MLYYIIYYSIATANINDGELYTIIAESYARNEVKDLTGLLVYIEGIEDEHFTARFMQVIEGREKAVKLVYDKILHDKRHFNISLLNEGYINERNFKDWHMKFERVNLTANHELEAFFGMEGELLESDLFRRSDIALNFLKSF